MKAVRVFISYSHKDQAYAEALRSHLAPLKRSGLIADWYDRMIRPGSDWAGEIDTRLDQSDVIILLVSADFFQSDYCHDVEMTHALQLRKEGRVTIIPVLVRSVMWEGTVIGDLQVLPPEGRPVELWERQDEAWRAVAAALSKVTLEMRAFAISTVDVQGAKHVQFQYPQLTLDRFLDNRAAYQTRIRAIQEEVMKALDTAPSIHFALVDVMVKLAEGHEEKLKFMMEETALYQSFENLNRELSKRALGGATVSPTSIGLPEKTGRQALADLESYMKEYTRTMKAIASIVKQLQEMILLPIRNIK